jgi:hypothetical protein
MALFPSGNAIRRPVCKICDVTMMLARISPDGEGYELRQFECAKCDHIEVERVATDPIPTATGWLSGELRPPT